jgi:hypothetical protein
MESHNSAGESKLPGVNGDGGGCCKDGNPLADGGAAQFDVEGDVMAEGLRFVEDQNDFPVILPDEFPIGALFDNGGAVA